jgi:hypothetical protein
MPADTIVAAPGAAVRAPWTRYLEWGPIFVGALGAAAISFVLLTFGSALGLSAVSPYPYRGLNASTFLIVATLYVAMVQVCSYAAGGYLAGRMRSPWPDGVLAERHFRDGAHGFAVWALSLVFGAVMLASGAGGVLKTATEAASAISAGAAAGAGPTVANRLSLELADYATDMLLRPAGTPTDAAPANPGAASAPVDRAPLARVFTASLKDGSLAAPDRTYLAQVVSQQMGLPQAEAEKRVDAAYNQAKAAEQKARDAANEARKKAALFAFLTAATLALACAAACVAAGLGGKDRDEGTARTYWMGTARFW